MSVETTRPRSVAVDLIRREGMTQTDYDNPFVKVGTTQVTFPDGSRGSYSTISSGSGEGVVLVPVLRFRGMVHVGLTIQHRWPVGAHTIEFPRGGLERGESPDEAAYRELTEETGIPATSVHSILEAGTIHPDTGLLDTRVSVQVVVVGPDELDRRYTERLTGLHFRWSPMGEFQGMIARGAVSCGMTLAAYLLAQSRNPNLFRDAI